MTRASTENLRLHGISLGSDEIVEHFPRRRLAVCTDSFSSELALNWVAVFCAGAVIGLQMISPETRVLSYAGLIALTVFRMRGPVEALSLSTFAILANDGLAPAAPALVYLKWILLAVCAVKLTFTHKIYSKPALRAQRAITIFTIAIAFLALATSSNPTLSIWKLLSWFLGVQVVIAALSDPGTKAAYWLSWLYSLYVSSLVASASIYFLPVGRWLNGRGFQGVFSHPQSFGIYLAPFTAVLTAELFTSRKLRWHNVAIMILGWVLLFASLCRTAVLAIPLGLTAALIGGLVSRRISIKGQLNGNTLARACGLLGMLTVFVILSGEDLRDELGSFLKKGRPTYEQSVVFDKGGIADSRESLILPQLEQFATKPLAGNGFGIAPEGIMQDVQSGDFHGIPLSAPIEPGYLPVALLAQMGIIGTMAWMFWFLPLSFWVSSKTSLGISILFWTAMFTQLGEASFFSFGGLGLQFWLLIGLSIRMSTERHRPHFSRWQGFIH